MQVSFEAGSYFTEDGDVGRQDFWCDFDKVFCAFDRGLELDWSVGDGSAHLFCEFLREYILSFREDFQGTIYDFNAG